jgi:hypothetical protein
VTHAAGMSPETLRKIETGRLPAPAFGTIACLGALVHPNPLASAAIARGCVQLHR